MGIVNSKRDAQQQLKSIAHGRCDDNTVLRELLESNHLRPDERDEKEPGRTLLSFATSNASATVVKTFLDSRKVDPDSRDAKGRTPLSYAVHGVDYRAEAIVKMLLETDRVDPDSRDNKGRTPLSYAAEMGANTIVEKLLSSNRVDPDSRDDNGRTPLSYAAGKGYNTIVRTLLDNERVDPESRDTSGRTPLLWAARAETRDLTIPLGLLQTGKVNPASRDEQGYTALWWAIGGGCKELVTLLLETGQVDVEAKEKSTGRSPLSHAVRVGSESSVKALLGTNDVNVNSKDDCGITPLMWAVERENLHIVDILLGDGRLLERSTDHSGLEVDARYLAYWQNSCNQDHGKDCASSPIEHRLPHQIPDWVIDTAEGCLVPGRTASRYIALSYVWVAPDTSTDVSTAERLMLTQKSLTQFQERGYLQGDALARLPYAVKDAIVLVQKYGERYLWVDCLCIVQDGDKTRDQVDNMGEVYAGAYLTIIAATTAGRLNTRKSTRCRSLDSTTQLYEKLFKTKWASRGWTFQEQMLSKRVIIFLDGEVFWDCQRCVWNRDYLTPKSAPDTTLTRPYYETARRMSTMSQPDLNMYIEMISLYNSRDLTYPQDALPAISGVLSTLKRTFTSGFINGLPCTFLDLALLWQPYSIASRRVARDGGSIAPRRGLPSWSWCGWQCPVDPHNLRSRFDYLKEDSSGKHTTNPTPSTWQTHRLVQWYALSEDMLHTWRVDEFDSLIMRPESALDKSAMFTGTQRSFHQSKYESWREGKTSGPVDTNTAPSSHRLSVSSYQASRSALQLRRDWPFLSCKTSTASLRLKAVLKKRSPAGIGPCWMGPSVFELRQFAGEPADSDMCHLICLEDKRGNQAGVLRHMNRDRAEPGDALELIALSTGTIRSEHLRNIGGDSGPLFKQEMTSKIDKKCSSEYLGKWDIV